MRYTRKYRHLYFLLAVSILVASCQKLDHPALGDYVKDQNPPGGPLKFYAAFDATKTGYVFDSIKANFGQPNDAAVVPGGVSDSAVQFTNNGYIKFPSAN